VPNRQGNISVEKHQGKLYKTNATMWYNKICRKKQLTHNYIPIKINKFYIPYILFITYFQNFNYIVHTTNSYPFVKFQYDIYHC